MNSEHDNGTTYTNVEMKCILSLSCSQSKMLDHMSL
jgi:hypothetical protein